MAKIFKCQNLEDKTCPWSMTVSDGEEELIVVSTLQHTETHHPAFFLSDEAEESIRAEIEDLLQQSQFYEQSYVQSDGMPHAA